MNRTLWIALLPLLLAGCDQLAEKAGMPNPAKVEAEGKAIGAACRHAGRGLEDCYSLNDRASKSAIYAGWKEMNEYMAQNKMEVVKPMEGGDEDAEESDMETDKKAMDDEEETGAKGGKAAH